jgi:hypothetical protein
MRMEFAKSLTEGRILNAYAEGYWIIPVHPVFGMQISLNQ